MNIFYLLSINFMNIVTKYILYKYGRLWSTNKEIKMGFNGSQCLGLWCLTPLSTILELSLRSIFIGGETGENHMLYRVHLARFELKTSVVLDTDVPGSCKSNYLSITTIMTPDWESV